MRAYCVGITVLVGSACCVFPVAALAQTPGSQGESTRTVQNTTTGGTSTETAGTAANDGSTGASERANTTSDTRGLSANRATSIQRTEEQQREREDDGRTIDYLFVQPEFGVAYTDLTALSSTGRLLPTLTQFQGFGLSGGATVGFRFGLVAIAAHGNISRFGGTATDTIRVSGFEATTTDPNYSFDLGQVMAEVHLRFPVPVVEPYVRAGFGYAWLGDFKLDTERYRESTSTVHGWTGHLGVGLDIWFAKVFTVGAGVDLGVLNLRRGGVMRQGSACPMTDPRCIELSQDGDAVGLLAHLHVQAGVHF